ncbi:electron transfer flavoprotein subunit alpha [Adhaeribacter arboris]|uniref:Electron transfer flavoprotein subunit alpha n=1 Tax=Adhaeribacter arboris TaxID=2072846 RepID=A0A2T2YDM8_9BACT|nr:electron transfer flavoprotein subunit alpha/FixB family protein [Adhaeribacter arboris]PSR53612.1 electron transfer flavoprotein subunit alpha [Adhaeribacter arboris]
MSVLVFIECADGKVKKSSFEAAFYGQQVAASLGTHAVAVAVGEVATEELKSLGGYGISRVLVDEEPRLKDYVSQAYTKVVAAATEKENATVIVLSNTNIGAGIGARLAARLQASYAANVVALPEVSGNSLKVKKSVFSGKAFAEETLTAAIKIIAVKKNSLEVKEPVSGEAAIESFSTALTDSDLTGAPQETIRATGDVLLTEADIVVSGGRGLRGPENWHLIEDLAKALGAATACSKPVADVGWRPHHEHVGQTGITISPNLYIAVGISGAIQHLAGVNSSKVIVVINKDPEAPFFKAADYGIVGDVFEVVPKLIEEAKALAK